MRLAEFTDVGNPAVDSLKTVLSMLGSSDDANAGITYNTDSIINMVRNTGQQFEYSDLAAALEDPDLKPLIANFNRKTLTLASENDLDAANTGYDNSEEDTVSSMAQRSLAKHKSKFTHLI